MNRSLANVILGGYGTTATGPAAKVEGVHTEIDVPGACEAITNGARGRLGLGWDLVEVVGWRGSEMGCAWASAPRLAAAAPPVQRPCCTSPPLASPPRPPTVLSSLRLPSLPLQPRRC